MWVLTSIRASERCALEKRKTITGEDILWAMGALSFDYYIEPLRIYLHRWREAERANAAKRANKDAAPAAATTTVPAAAEQAAAAFGDDGASGPGHKGAGRAGEAGESEGEAEDGSS